jgi:hypothetical protein
MLPEFAADVDQVAAMGASRYELEVKLEWPKESALSQAGLYLKGQEQIRYTNTENIPLSELYFHLYPNLPGYDGSMNVDKVSIDGHHQFKLSGRCARANPAGLQHFFHQ